LPAAEIEAFIATVPDNVVVVLDEAYNEYLDPGLQYAATDWVKRYPNLLVSRTFSKIYGLAGLRIGVGVAQPGITDLLNRVRQPFNVNSFAQAAAVAVLDDRTFLEKSAKLNADGYRQLTKAFDEMRLEYVPSYGNFVLVRVGDDDDAGARVNLALLKKGFIVRPVGGYGLPKWLRITIGLPEENAAFILALREALA
jgi:histidinol-phosphate aminotransferase